MSDEYFRFEYYGDDWDDLIETGRYVFKNVNNKVNATNGLVPLIFHFIVDYNLQDLELFFKLAGFNSFTIDEMPDSLTKPSVIPLVIKGNFRISYNGVSREEIIKYIEKEFGNGIISRFYEVKKAQSANNKDLSYGFCKLFKRKK